MAEQQKCNSSTLALNSTFFDWCPKISYLVVLPLKFSVWERTIGKVPATLRKCDVKLLYWKEMKPSPSQVLIHKHIQFLPFSCTTSDQSHVFPIPQCAAFWLPCVVWTACNTFDFLWSTSRQGNLVAELNFYQLRRNASAEEFHGME